jgi:hypothetical protein
MTCNKLKDELIHSPKPAVPVSVVLKNETTLNSMRAALVVGLDTD